MTVLSETDMYGSSSSMTVEIRLFAMARSRAGVKSLTLRFDGRTVDDAINQLVVRIPALSSYVGEGDATQGLVVLVNGTPTASLNGPETELADGDTLALSPPVTGG